MPRAIPEWQGRTDDSQAPTRVLLRVMDGQRPEPNALPVCPLCGNEIRIGDGTHGDHITPLADGGENREMNLQIVHARCHKLKTAREAQERAEHRAKVAKAYGLKRPKHSWPKRKMNERYVPNVRQLHDDLG